MRLLFASLATKLTDLIKVFLRRASNRISKQNIMVDLFRSYQWSLHLHRKVFKDETSFTQEFPRCFDDIYTTARASKINFCFNLTLCFLPFKYIVFLFRFSFHFFQHLLKLTGWSIANDLILSGHRSLTTVFVCVLFLLLNIRLQSFTTFKTFKFSQRFFNTATDKNSVVNIKF